MALDVYVMPLWRFKANDFDTPLEQLFGDKVKTISSSGIHNRQQPTRAFSNITDKVRRYFIRRRAAQEVQALVSDIDRQLGIRPKWNDDGSVEYSIQAWWGLEGLRAYAKWLDVRSAGESFEDPPEGDFYKHPVWNCGDPQSPLRFEHVVNHSCFSGYYLPSRFERIIDVEPYQIRRWTFHRNVGSSLKLAEQLSQLEPHIPPSSGMNEISAKSAEIVRAGFDVLKEACAKSISKGLPIIFFG